MSLNLEEELKRLLVVTICLHKTLPPTLHNFLSSKMKTHYDYLKEEKNIHEQTYGAHYGNNSLNYGNINNNEVNHKKESHLYDYNVKSEVELAKLYLKPFMAKFTGFDDTCDLSTVLNILGSVHIFSGPIKDCSDDVRQKVRNEWAHCDVTNWSDQKYSECFRSMESLVRALGLPEPDEKKVTDELKKWKINGLQLCVARPVEADLVKFIEKIQSEEAGISSSNGLKILLGFIKKHNKSIEGLKESQEITSVRVDVREIHIRESQSLVTFGSEGQPPIVSTNKKVSHLNAEIYRRVCALLDVENDGKDWRTLAGKMGYTNQDVKLLTGKSDGLLSNWGTKSENDLPKLIKFLSEMQRDDVITVLNEENV